MGEQFASGVELMFIGMGIVFVFLAMLIVAVTMMSWVINRFFPEPQGAANSLPSTTLGKHDDQDTVAAISAAIHRYRNDHSH